jgi:hypothetical protein
MNVLLSFGPLVLFAAAALSANRNIPSGVV